MPEPATRSRFESFVRGVAWLATALLAALVLIERSSPTNTCADGGFIEFPRVELRTFWLQPLYWLALAAALAALIAARHRGDRRAMVKLAAIPLLLALIVTFAWP